MVYHERHSLLSLYSFRSAIVPGYSILTYLDLIDGAAQIIILAHSVYIEWPLYRSNIGIASFMNWQFMISINSFRGQKKWMIFQL
jgi:hypothetical protein